MPKARHIDPVLLTPTATTLAPAPNHTAASLVERHGVSDRDAVEAYVSGEPIADIFLRGQRVSTSRLVGDGVPMLGEASDFVLTATAAQKELIVTIDAQFNTSGPCPRS